MELPEPGQWWAVGEHRLLCGDLTGPDGEAVIDMAGTIDAVYTDPPWDAGMIKRYRTVSKRTDLAPEIDWTAFAARLAQLWSGCAGDVWVAMSAGGCTEILAATEAAGARLLARQSITAMGTPCQFLHLRYAEGDGADVVTNGEFCDMGADVLFGLPPGATVVDWCLGLGSTALAAQAGGWRFVGSELAPHRLAESLRRLSRATGEKPRLLGEKSPARLSGHRAPERALSAPQGLADPYQTHPFISFVNCP
jgi:hypothetical protein